MGDWDKEFRIAEAQLSHRERMDNIRMRAEHHASEFLKERGALYTPPQWTGPASVFQDAVYLRDEMAAQAKLKGFTNQEVDVYRQAFRKEYQEILDAEKEKLDA